MFEYFLKICQENSSFVKILTRIMGTLLEDQYTFLIISRSFLLRIRNVWGKICGENQNTHFIQQLFFFQIRAIYEIMWKNIIEPDRPQMTINTAHAHCILDT